MRHSKFLERQRDPRNVALLQSGISLDIHDRAQSANKNKRSLSPGITTIVRLLESNWFPSQQGAPPHLQASTGQDALKAHWV